MVFKAAPCRAYGGYCPDTATAESALVCDDVSKTRQADAKEADINTIVRNFGVTGALPQGVRVPSFQDFDEIYDYRSAIEAVRAAETSFMQMPAQVRARFQNDPQEFVEFCSDPANLPELRELGLAVPLPGEPESPVRDGK